MLPRGMAEIEQLTERTVAEMITSIHNWRTPRSGIILPVNDLDAQLLSVALGMADKSECTITTRKLHQAIGLSRGSECLALVRSQA